MDNIMIGSADPRDKSSDIKLIDFGLAEKYLDKNGDHIERTEVDEFRGNILFGSHNTMSFHTSTRKNDLISLSYLLIFIISR